LTGQCDDVINEIHSQMMFKFGDSLRIRRFDCGEKVQWIKASQGVPAPLVFGQRHIAGGVPERRCVQVTACGSSTGREEDDGEY
jgi:hypothetical protein